ncbi:MAG: toxin-antitoxin system HicB family antitoxin [Dehalococcoidales bacterium]|nr:toxin-antitoxin system HicB family antitoxin [Dehalococcoidales bacterium]
MARITLRLPEELHRRLAQRSQRAGVSLNQLIVATLHDAAAEHDSGGEGEDPLAEQVQHIRAALSDMAVELDTGRLPPHLRPGDDLPDRETYRRSLPQIQPSLSATIIADREDRL